MSELSVRPCTMAQAEKLSRAIRLRTVSALEESQAAREAFEAFERLLEAEFPLVHVNLQKTRVGDRGLVFEWRGRSVEALPGLVLAHYDVVPAGEDDPGWTHCPFSGTIDRGYVYGRGALDMKGTLVSILEAAELLLAEGFTPYRSMFFAFGGDEELGGRRGARRIAAWFAGRKLRFEYVIDEGSVIASGLVPGIDRPLALIGTAEKGNMNVVLSVRGKAGHASMPPPETALLRLAEAMVRIGRCRFASRLTYTVRGFFTGLAPCIRGLRRAAFSHPGPFRPLLAAYLSRSPFTNALIRTTTALTMASASPLANVLPDLARAVVNVRILPGESRSTVLARLRRVVRDPIVELSEPQDFEGNDPVPETRLDGAAYRLVSATVSALLPGTVAVPFLVTVATDSKAYREVSQNIIRFTPVVLTQADLSLIHGVDERISLENLGNCIWFFYHLMKETALDGAEP